MSLFTTIYGTMAFQNTQGFNSAARTPHEARMASMLGNWRLNVRILLLLSIATLAVAFLNHPSFPANIEAKKVLASIPEDQIRGQMRVSVALRFLLPDGLRGLFCSTMIMGLIAGDSTHMHSWSSIFIQDVILPFRRKPLSTRQHLWLLRLSTVFVAVFALVFSICFTMTHYIAMWWSITQAIFISGAGAAIIGGLYWRKGTTGAAWAAVIVGSILAFASILLNQPSFWNAAVSHLQLADMPAKFPYNGVQCAFVIVLIASATYIVVSLLTCTVDFNLDRMLHRGEYADGGAGTERKRPLLARLANIDDSFTAGDRRIAIMLVGWTLGLALINAVIAIINLFFQQWTLGAWETYWLIFGVGVPLLVGTVTFVWFTIGGIIDTRDFFRALSVMKRDFTDNGRVAVSGEDAKRAAEQAIASQTPSPGTPGEARGEGLGLSAEQIKNAKPSP
jgi:SSS family solute:Na+ symporter